MVVKPTVGAGARDAAWHGADATAEARAHVERLLARGRAALVQPLLTSVARDGEWPLLFFDGVFSHAARKRVVLPEGRAMEVYAESLDPYEPDDEQLAVASAVMRHVQERFGTPTYARVDLVRGDDGRPLVLEVELVEPSLFLPQAPPGAVTRLVSALRDG